MDLGTFQVGCRRLAASAAITAGLLSTVMGGGPAEARSGGYNPPYAEMVVDAKTGRVLRATNEDELRFPASLTKVMTLYLLFERLEQGSITLATPILVSAKAAAQEPSKLGLAAGSAIATEDAIKALVTKSANDVAVAIAETLAGSEEAFAEAMTRKAHALGMARTTYRGASGLPDPKQVTTARDQVTLGRAIQDRFPKFYAYFQTAEFRFGGQSVRNHNRLLGRVEGVDGIKTGFTRASGFNLITSARQGDRHIVAAVLGGRSGAARDQIMTKLVKSYLPRAFAGARTAPLVAEAAGAPSDQAARPLSAADRAAMTEGERRRAVWTALTGQEPDAIVARSMVPEDADPKPRPAGQTGDLGKPVRLAAVEPTAADLVLPSKDRPKPASGSWAIQLAATGAEAAARSVLDRAKSRAGQVLQGASATTETIADRGRTQFRARFAGFGDRRSALSACVALSRAGFGCFVVPPG